MGSAIKLYYGKKLKEIQCNQSNNENNNSNNNNNITV